MYCEVDCQSKSCDKDVRFLFFTLREQSMDGKMTIEFMFDITSFDGLPSFFIDSNVNLKW
jgi:hypothetical protein